MKNSKIIFWGVYFRKHTPTSFKFGSHCYATKKKEVN